MAWFWGKWIPTKDDKNMEFIKPNIKDNDIRLSVLMECPYNTRIPITENPYLFDWLKPILVCNDEYEDIIVKDIKTAITIAYADDFLKALRMVTGIHDSMNMDLIMNQVQYAKDIIKKFDNNMEQYRTEDVRT